MTSDSERRSCPSESELLALTVGDFEDPNLRAVVQHLDNCESCQDRFGEIASRIERDSNSVSGANATEFARRILRFVRGETLANVELFDQHQQPMPDQLGIYRVDRELGRGGMGIVYKAWDTKLQRPVAIKQMRTALAKLPDIQRRILGEARAVAAFHDSNIVSVISVHEDADPPYFVMQYVDGSTLEDTLAETGKLDVERTIKIATQIAAGLAIAHENGVIHCDLKPANVLISNLGERESIQLADFGVSLAERDDEINNDSYLGTPHYMSPEQCRREKLDARTDLFSLGVILHQSLTGIRPFEAASIAELRDAICEQKVPIISPVRKDVPRWLDELITQLLNKNKDQRIQSAKEVVRRIEHHTAPKHRIWQTLALGTLAVLLCSAVLFVRGQKSLPVNTPSDSWAQPKFQLTGRMVGVAEAVQPGFGTTLATAGNWTATGDFLGYSRMGRTGCVFLVNKTQFEKTTSVPIVLSPENQYSRTFGYTLAMDKKHLVVGAPLELTPNKQVGAAYVYDLHDGECRIAQRLVAPTIIPNARFGFSIAIKDDTIVIGSPENEITSGHVYVFRKQDGKWEEVQSINTKADGEGIGLRHFGHSVLFANDQLVVADPIFENSDDSSGRLYLYDRSEEGFQLVQTLSHTIVPCEEVGHSMVFNDSHQHLIATSRSGGTANQPLSFQLLIFAKKEQHFRLSQTIELQEPTESGVRLTLATSGNDLYVSQTVDYDDGTLGRTNARPTPTILRFNLENGLWVQGDSQAIAEPESDPKKTRSIGALAFDDSHRLVVGWPQRGVKDKSGSLVLVNPRDESKRNWTPEPIHGTSPQKDLFFGRSFALESDCAYVSAHNRNQNGLRQAGEINVFRRRTQPGLGVWNGWEYETSIRSSKPIKNGRFGSPVCVYGKNLATVEWQDDSFQRLGLRVFRHDTSGVELVQSIDIESHHPYHDDWWHTITMNDSDLMVSGFSYIGAEKYNRPGKVSVFQKRGGVWSRTQTISMPKFTGVDRFGCCLSLLGDTLIVGCKQGNDIFSHDCGRVFVFQKQSSGEWKLQQELKPGEEEPDALFGASVQLSDDSIFVGAPRYGERGAVLVYRKEGSQWLVDQIVKGPNEQENHFGAFISQDGDNLVVGRVPHYDPAGFKHIGTAHVYKLRNSKWEHFQVLKTPQPFSQLYTGTVVGVKDNTILYLSSENKGADAVYAFELN